MSTQQTEWITAENLARELGTNIDTLGVLDQDGDMIEERDGILVVSADMADVFRDQLIG